MGVHNPLLSEEAQEGAWSLAQMNNYTVSNTMAEIAKIISSSQIILLLNSLPKRSPSSTCKQTKLHFPQELHIFPVNQRDASLA